MRKYIGVLVVLFNMIGGSVFAHSDYFHTKLFGNVETSILTGFRYEEINKVSIFGQLAEKMSKELNYSGLIFLSFGHSYTQDIEPVSFISVDSISYWDANSEQWLKDEGIVIRQFAKHFKAHTTLKLLEYAITNQKKVKSTQKEVKYEGRYDLEITSIDTLEIKKILKTSNSNLLNNILESRIDRPEKDFREGISYYWKNDRYFIFMRYHMWWNKERQDYDYPEYVLLDVENVYDFHIFKNWSAVIFDTDSSFYSIKQSELFPFGSGTHIQKHEPKISQRHVIENAHEYYQPFKVDNIGGDKVSINFRYYSKEAGFEVIDRTLIYLVEEDELIQDFDELLKKR